MKLRFFFILNLIIIICLSCNKLNWNLNVLPKFGQIVLEENTLSSANVSVDIFKGSNSKNTTFGFCISENTLPTINDSIVLVKPDDNISKLKLLLKWGNKKSLYIRAFVKNDLGINYSIDILKLVWPPILMIPKVSLKSIDSVSFYFVDCSATILNDGGLPILSKGFIISKEDYPTMDNSLIFDSKSDISVFSNRNNGLFENTIYNVRAFIKNTYTTSLSDEVFKFKTENFYEIGEIGPAGGKIFYSIIDGSTKWHFLETTLLDDDIELNWSIKSSFIKNLNHGIGYGLENTNLIVADQGEENLYATLIAKQFIFNGFKDWFLPSRDELKELINQESKLGIFNFVKNEKYWSSSQDPNFSQNAWLIINSNPISIYTNSKISKAKVRFIRRF